MRVRYLGWAGIEIEAGGETVIVDAVQGFGVHSPFMGEPRGPLLAPGVGSSRAALLTHLHLDHADAATISAALAEDGVVLRPRAATGEMLETAGTAPAEEGLAELGLECVTMDPWESRELGAFTVTAVPASDGFGDPQVSWVIEADGQRLLHAGDTLFHGAWWLIKMRLGAIDAAFLPVNAPIADLPHRQPPSPQPVVMSPEQAAAAAMILEAPLTVPIHFREIHNPPVYVQIDDPAAAFTAAASELGVETRVMETGEVLGLESAATL